MCHHPSGLSHMTLVPSSHHCRHTVVLWSLSHCRFIIVVTSITSSHCRHGIAVPSTSILLCNFIVVIVSSFKCDYGAFVMLSSSVAILPPLSNRHDVVMAVPLLSHYLHHPTQVMPSSSHRFCDPAINVQLIYTCCHPIVLMLLSCYYQPCVVVIQSSSCIRGHTFVMP